MSGGSVIAILFGLAFAGAGVYLYVQADRLTRAAAEAQGTVVEVVLVPSGSGSNREYPVIRFQTADGRQVEFRSSQHCHCAVGEALTMSYDPANPARAMIGTRAGIRRERLIIAAVFITFGGLVCCMGYLFES